MKAQTGEYGPNTSSELAARDAMPARPVQLQMYERMLLIRRMEERLGDDFKAGKLPGPVHLYIGQEATAVGVCIQLSDIDWITSTHRGHGHFLAKGGEPKQMMAEVYGRSTGICKGMGGSMHVADMSRGIMGANGIVGGGIGLAVGAALAAQLDGRGAVVATFFGDGAANQGVLMEAFNLASLWSLPLVFVCENNGFSEFSPSATVTSGAIVDRGKPFLISCADVDGNNVLAVWQTASQAIERARGGGGPSLIEAITYRLRGHVEAESQFLAESYRSADDIARWRARDPIETFATSLKSNGIADDAALSLINERVTKLVEEATAFAESSPFPEPDSIYGCMFSNQNP